MTNHTKRTLTAVLALLCVSSAALSSCGDASDGSVDTSPATQAETEAIETEAIDPRLEYANAAPAVEDFGGYTYRMAVTEGKEAMGSALVKLRADGKLYAGTGISTDIIGASIRAYISAVNKIVFEQSV